MVDKAEIKASVIVQNFSENISEDGINFKEFLDLIGDHGILLANLIFSCAISVTCFNSWK